MRIFFIVLIFLTSQFTVAEILCGYYKVQVYVPEKTKGLEVYANPKATSSLKMSLKKAIAEDYWGRMIEIKAAFKKPCLGSCEVSEYKVIRTIPPFEKLKNFNHDKHGLVKKMKCEKDNFN
jgi:hypothetical protein